MIENFIDSALIIDDKENEITDLKILLESKDIWTKFYAPEELRKLNSPLKNRKIIFLDLYVDEKITEVIGQISIIRKIFEKAIGLNFGTYGVVLWSAHLDEIVELKKRIKNDAEKYNLPLFIVGLYKNKYIQNGYSDVLTDLNNELKINIASSFFVEWSTLINEGKDTAITNIYSLVKDYEVQNDNLRFLLFQLARNLTGIPIDQIEKYSLYNDAFIAFNDMMTYEITKKIKTNHDFFKEPKKIQFRGLSENTKPYTRRGPKEFFFNNTSIKNDDPAHVNNINLFKNELDDIYSKINSITLFDENNLDDMVVLPGNIYEIIDEKSSFLLRGKPNGSVPIIIEMTPKCDFAQGNKLNHKVLAGYITDYDISKIKDQKDFIYKEIYPLHISNKPKPQMMLFDLRLVGFILETELLDQTKYKLIYRVKDKLYADILQKLSSHMARLGLSIIH